MPDQSELLRLVNELVRRVESLESSPRGPGSAWYQAMARAHEVLRSFAPTAWFKPEHGVDYPDPIWTARAIAGELAGGDGSSCYPTPELAEDLVAALPSLRHLMRELGGEPAVGEHQAEDKHQAEEPEDFDALVFRTCDMMGRATSQIALVKAVADGAKRRRTLDDLAKDLRIWGKRRADTVRTSAGRARKTLETKGCPLRLEIRNNEVRLMSADGRVLGTDLKVLVTVAQLSPIIPTGHNKTRGEKVMSESDKLLPDPAVIHDRLSENQREQRRLRTLLKLSIEAKEDQARKAQKSPLSPRSGEVGS